MKTFNRICAQGDVMIMKIDEAPSTEGMKKVDPEGGKLIVTHSETGHHHVLDRDAAEMFQSTDNELESLLFLKRDAELTHLRSHDTHESILIKAGSYKVIRQREYTAEGFRKAQD